jgi:segregation and condensation protein B
MSETDATHIIEALLFVADEPLSAGKIAEAVGVGAQEVRALVEGLRAEYEAEGRAFTIEELAGGYRMFTRPEYHPYLRIFTKEPREVKLSPAALETLAIVAYKQPINRAQVEAIRGVDSSGVIQRLLEYRLIKIVGRSEELGRPLLYGTTKEFLEHFGLKSIRDLPKVQELLQPEASVGPEAAPSSATQVEPVGPLAASSAGEEPPAEKEPLGGEGLPGTEGDVSPPEPSASPPSVETTPSA